MGRPLHVGVRDMRRVHPKALLNNPTRAKIYECIKGNPGIHLRGLMRELDMALGTAQYHIGKLVHARLVSIKQDGRKKSLEVII